MEKICKVSIIVPVYNVEKYIAVCLSSLIVQTIDSYEVIIVDDGSTDGSASIIKKYVDEYPQLIKFYEKENGGLGSARNLGLQYASGEYIGFVDSDDWIDPKMYATMYEMANKENLDCVVCDFTSIYDGWKTGWVSRGYRGEESTPTHCDFMRHCMNPATACNKLFRAEMFYITKFAEIWYEDVATTPILFSYANKIGYLPIALYYYRQQDNSITHSVRNPHSLDIINAWDRALNNCKEEYRNEIVYSIYKSVCSFINFKPEYADEYIQYARENKELFYNNNYVKNDIKNRVIEDVCVKRLIPKKIHYFWFGGGEKSELIKKCMASWKKYAPDYEIIEWNENNCNINECAYVKEAYEHKKWAFVADYFRIKKVYEEGGIYMDTDVELTNDIAPLRLNEIFFAFETRGAINAATFGSVAKYPLLKDWLETYKNDHLVNADGTYNTSNTIVVRLTKLLTKKYKYELNGKTQLLGNQVKIYAPNILTLNMYDGKNIAQHHYDASWWDAKAGVTSYKYEVLKDYFTLLPHNFTNVNKDEYINSLQAQIWAYENSTCWKLTKPLRKLVDFLRSYKK
ncbi:glycosyltransferase involved in cell wall biosynthesis [Hungatella effluvii]|uniref:Glycosyltransferase involved in cell wall biosynthesis n=1 Tax=Hungatella effluvii TaxID=1096246 RepID=A0A2V3XXA6_9FIRM|nr:glycosyltransferase [Hungatella effluvii]PXX48929.1 glycosyltransferase involved in cell wall biosynthesis [Hungatella effluvii]